MEEELREENGELEDPQEVDGMPVPEGFSDMLLEETQGNESLDQESQEREDSLAKASAKIMEKASIMLHKAWHESMVKQGRPGFRDVPPEEVGKISVLCIPEKIKRQHPLLTLASIYSGILADNYVINSPEKKDQDQGDK